jgi:hypothetical protein
VTARDFVLEVSDPALGVLNNDVDTDGPQPLIARNPSAPSQGVVAQFNPDGTFTYVPNEGASGSDTFTYQAFDGAAATTATVTITFDAGLRR